MENEKTTALSTQDSLRPTEYFDHLMGKLERIERSITEQEYVTMEKLLRKYLLTGQILGAKKLEFYMSILERERKLLELGVQDYVWLGDITTYVDSVEGEAVKFIELVNYPREIPDEVVERYTATKDLFDVHYVLYTDYTGETGQYVDELRRDKDPILFGGMAPKEKIPGIYALEKMYVIGDWEDEYCDLTLSKMVSEMAKGGHYISNEIPTEHLDIERELKRWKYVRGTYVEVAIDEDDDITGEDVEDAELLPEKKDTENVFIRFFKKILGK